MVVREVCVVKLLVVFEAKFVVLIVVKVVVSVDDIVV